MLHGQGLSASQPGQQEFTWLDYIVLSNPQGVMKVLASHGYTGYLSPQDEDELIEACLDLMDKQGDQAVIDLLKSHPLYDVIAEMSLHEHRVAVPFKNAAGDFSSIITTVKSIDYRSLAENALIIIGTFYLAGLFWNYISKSDA